MLSVFARRISVARSRALLWVESPSNSPRHRLVENLLPKLLQRSEQLIVRELLV
jgi:hypothetical protein